jgi:WD40 repeat protein
MRGRQIGNWIGNRQAAQIAPEDAGLTQPRLRRIRFGRIAPAILLLMLVVAVGWWLRRDGGYRRFIASLREGKVQYVEFQPYPNSPFVRIGDPLGIEGVADWLHDTQRVDRRYGALPSADCEMRIVMADGSTKRLWLGQTGPTRSGGNLLPSNSYVMVRGEGWERAAFSGNLSGVYMRLPVSAQLPFDSIPLAPAPVVPNRAIISTDPAAFGEIDPSQAQTFLERGQLGQAKRFIARAVAADASNGVAQQLMLDTQARIRIRLPQMLKELEEELPVNSARLQRERYLQLRETLLEATLMSEPGDERVGQLQARLMKVRPEIDPRGLNEIIRLAGRSDERYLIQDFAWSPDGTMIASCGDDEQVRIWDSRSGRSFYRFKATGGKTIQFSADGQRVKVSWGAGGMWWDLSSGKVSSESEPAQQRKHPYSAELDGSDKIFIRADGKLITQLLGHAGEVRLARISPDGDQVATFGEDRVLSIWGEGSGSEMLQLQPHERFRQIQTLQGPSVFLGDGSILTFLEGAKSLERGNVGQFQNVVCNLPVKIDRLEFAANKSRILAEMQDGKLTIIDLASHQIFSPARPAGSSGRLGLSPNGKTIAVGIADGSVLIMNAESGDRAAKLAGGSGPRKWASASFSSDGGWVMACGEGRISVWATSNGEQILDSSKAFSEGIPASFAPDGKQLALGYRNGSLLMLKGALRESDATGSEANGPIRAVAFNSDGRHIAGIGKDKVVQLYDAKNMRMFLNLGCKSHGDDPDDLRFTQDGRVLAFKGEDRSVRLFDVVAGRELRILKLNEAKHGQEWLAMPISFSPDEKYLIAGPMVWGVN